MRRILISSLLVALLAPSVASEATEAARPLDKAVHDAQVAVEQNPDSATALIRLGNAYRDAAQLEPAIDAYDRATKADSANAVAWNNLGVALNLARSSGRARSAFQRAVAADPRNAEARYNLAHLLLDAGQFEAAVAELELALRLDSHLGETILNPRVAQSRLVLPARLRLYLENIASTTLPAQSPGGESGITRRIDAAWLGNISNLKAVPTKGSGKAASPAVSPTLAPAPTPVPTPIELGPSSIPDAPASAGRPGQPAARPTPRPRKGRNIRSGGPQNDSEED